MNVRDDMLIALVKEILGPRDGFQEVLPLDQDPYSEYITGVLEPVSVSTAPERIEDNVDEVIEETSSDEDQDNEGYVAAPGVFSPALDPRALPRSIGISFTVESPSGDPQIEVCATWARYSEDHDGWHRLPAFHLTGMINAAQDKQDWRPEPGVRLSLRSRLLAGGARRVSIFLVNETEVADGKRPDTFDYLFQPQLRARLVPGTCLLPVQLGGAEINDSGLASEAEEEKSTTMQFRHRAALARGHMCAAIWQEIDPERPQSSVEHPQEAPFYWTDAEIVPMTERGKFAQADVRSELVPLYLVQAPEMIWAIAYGPSPVLDPAVLAETWQSEKLREALKPLVAGYRAWILEQEQRIPSLDAAFKAAAQSNIASCRWTADRIEEAIALLCSDEDVRLAFCFANKAMETQARWKNSQQPLIWRPFQLAFILLNIPALADPFHPDRDVCDLLWFPTGGGKTEAYLGLIAFVLGLRRLRARHDITGADSTGAGVGVISRYTLRLLTIQQFRRALGMVTACELLRVSGLKEGKLSGWRPSECRRADRFLWGGARFAAGLWVGGAVTPNRLHGIGPLPAGSGGRFTYYAGALDILRGLCVGYSGPQPDLAKLAQNQLQIQGEPAQVTQCPACSALLAIPDEGLGEGRHTLHFVFLGGRATTCSKSDFRAPKHGVTIEDSRLSLNGSYRTLSLTVALTPRAWWKADEIDRWWEAESRRVLSTGGSEAQLQAVRASRPGYFVIFYRNSQGAQKAADFEIFCPNPDCELSQHSWAEQVPLSREYSGQSKKAVQQAMLGLTSQPEEGLPVIYGENRQWQVIPEPFQQGKSVNKSRSIPIPACTVDDQVYHRCPSLVIATVDKFARLAFEPDAGALFGNVSHYHSRFGYYREGSPPGEHPNPRGYAPHPKGRDAHTALHCDVTAFAPPELILQDELHLIEGPLGSMVGLYETAVDLLCQREVGSRTTFPKYIASTATVRRAEAQVQSLFNRRLLQFPPPAISADQRFFATHHESHPLDASRAGRLYVGVCAPGRGAQTPIVRIWSALLQHAEALRGTTNPNTLDPFWTLVGYFNAIRELAGALSLYRQDIPEWLKHRVDANSRDLDDYRKLELSSRASSTDLPVMLKKLEATMPSALDAIFATSMFGTGVDVDRLSLMVVHGQPKTTASYIQATGRVGRKTSGLVVVFFRASRPRDLDHYEFFTGYHRALYRYVEPVTVAPFSPRARERCLGPLAVVLLRQARALNGTEVPVMWRVQQRPGSSFYAGACLMADRRHKSEVEVIPDLFEARGATQPLGRLPAPGVVAVEAASELDRWQSIAARHPSQQEFVYSEPAMLREPQHDVVLGDPQHHQRFEEAYENAPQSLRDVEETTTFEE